MRIPKIFLLPGALAQAVLSSTMLNSRYGRVIRHLRRQPDGEHLSFIIRFWYVENAWLLVLTPGLAVPSDSGALFRRMKGGEASIADIALELRDLDAPTPEEIRQNVQQSVIAESRKWPVAQKYLALRWPELQCGGYDVVPLDIPRN
ncbi:hypothetical protein MCEMSE15_01467 [Fimbriimonadaceae bacterium]